MIVKSIAADTQKKLNRRGALSLFGAVGAGFGLGVGCGSTNQAVGADAADAGSTGADGGDLPGCVLTPEATEGPFFVDEKLERSDLLAGEIDAGVSGGYPLTLTLSVLGFDGRSCQPLPNAYVDIWQANVPGLYSDEPSNFVQSTDTKGLQYLRGYQVTGKTGVVAFKTIYPGWYATRTIHIHVKIRVYSAAGDKTLEANAQVYFDDAMNDAVLALPAYATRGPRFIPRNTNDQVYNGTGPGSGIDNVGLASGQIPPGSKSIAVVSPINPVAGSTASLTVAIRLAA